MKLLIPFFAILCTGTTLENPAEIHVFFTELDTLSIIDISQNTNFHLILKQSLDLDLPSLKHTISEIEKIIENPDIQIIDFTALESLKKYGISKLPATIYIKEGKTHVSYGNIISIKEVVKCPN
ncbi:MAG: hypothetical protein HY606_02365 [Planctomycetes bacterium]|nr:hypothetical protein [Planctomycetota bacterium]